MSPVRFNRSPKLPISRVFVIFLLIIVLTACETNPGTATKASASNPLNLNATNFNMQQGDLLVQSQDGFQCSSNAIGYVGEVDQLVLASNRTTYSQAEITQMRAYIASSKQVDLTDLAGSEPPPTLRWALGGSMDSILGTVTPDVPCKATLELTNTGNVSIQIPKIGVQLEERPQQNSYQYRLINACDFLPQLQGQEAGCYQIVGGNGGTTCSIYFASIQLGPGEQHAVFSTVPHGTDESGADCGTLTIAPAAQVKLYIDFSLTPNTPKNLIYPIAPIFTVDTAQGEQTLALSQLARMLVFASSSQFSCYGLQGTTFVVLHSPDIQQNWCM